MRQLLWWQTKYGLVLGPPGVGRPPTMAVIGPRASSRSGVAIPSASATVASPSARATTAAPAVTVTAQRPR